MNTVILSGRLTKDPEIRHSQTDNEPIAVFTLAVQRNKETADFINCKAFKKTAEIIEKFNPGKGDKLTLEGRIVTGSYEKQDGTKVYTTDVVANTIEFDTPRSKNEPTPLKSNPTPSSEGFYNASDEGIPFR